MNSRTDPGTTTTKTAVTLAALLILAAATLAVPSTATETDVLPTITMPDPAEAPAAAVVIGLRRSVGFSLLGIDFGEVAHTVSVQLYAPAGCIDHITQGDSWPVPFEGCAGPVTIAGVVSGGGIAATGESIIVIDVDVSEDCYESIRRGEYWPPTSATCSAHLSDTDE